MTAPALASERNSYIGSKYGDAASVRSGLLGGGHGRNDSMTGSIAGREHRDREREMVTAPTSPLVDGAGYPAVAQLTMPGRTSTSRRSSTFLDGQVEDDTVKA